MSLTALTVKSLLTWTSTSVPSDLRMCASYGALESTLVSTRSTVPGTLASAAARTLEATSPVSGFSVLPLTVWPPWGGRPWLVAGGDAEDVADGDDDGAFPDVAALAIAAPPTAAAPTAAAVTSLDRMLPMRTPFGDDGTCRSIGPGTVSATRSS